MNLAMGLRLSARVLLGATALLLLAALGCTEKIALPTAVVGPPPVFVTPDSIQAIFTSRCIGCHTGAAPAGGMNLTADSSYKYTVNVPSGACATLDRVEPGDPNNSCIVRRIEGTVTPRMPLGGGPLSPADITKIRNWIAQGAPGTIAGPAL
jgi:mono/diheme cytochrome c family protein